MTTRSLERFVIAQDAIYDRVLAELRSGKKLSHWMWFIFPQLKGLGFTVNAELYGLEHLDEARAYLAHDVLRERLLECTEIVAKLEGLNLWELFGATDAKKFRSSMTLFRVAEETPGNIFEQQLHLYCRGTHCPLTVAMLEQA